VVVGGKKSVRAKVWVVMNVFHNRPGDGYTVVGAGASTDFVQDEQRAGRGMMEDICGFDHLDHKGRLPGMDFILCTDAGENAVDQPDLR